MRTVRRIIGGLIIYSYGSSKGRASCGAMSCYCRLKSSALVPFLFLQPRDAPREEVRATRHRTVLSCARTSTRTTRTASNRALWYGTVPWHAYLWRYSRIIPKEGIHRRPWALDLWHLMTTDGGGAHATTPRDQTLRHSRVLQAEDSTIRDHWMDI